MDFLISGLLAITWKQLVMYLIGLLLIYLAIKKNMSHLSCFPWDLVPFWSTFPSAAH